MPFGNSVGEAVMKQLSGRQSDLGGGQKRVEIDYAGEATGEMRGNTYGTFTLVIDENDDPARPIPFSYTGTTLTSSGAIVHQSLSGLAQRTGEGHKMRLRGVGRSSTKDPKLAAFNNVILAMESEIDPATSTLKGGGCEWK
jgi:hypothetical protein